MTGSRVTPRPLKTMRSHSRELTRRIEAIAPFFCPSKDVSDKTRRTNSMWSKPESAQTCWVAAAVFAGALSCASAVVPQELDLRVVSQQTVARSAWDVHIENLRDE